MIYNLTVKGFHLDSNKLSYINRYIEKINKFLPFKPDLSIIDLIIRKHKEKRLDHGNKKIPFGEESIIFKVFPKFKSNTYYDGKILLRLSKKPLVANFCETTIDKAINLGFERLIKELETYKGKHFTSNSEYFDHRTIRKEEQLK